jgi:hypothetical protein
MMMVVILNQSNAFFIPVQLGYVKLVIGVNGSWWSFGTPLDLVQAIDQPGPQQMMQIIVRLLVLCSVLSHFRNPGPSTSSM